VVEPRRVLLNVSFEPTYSMWVRTSNGMSEVSEMWAPRSSGSDSMLGSMASQRETVGRSSQDLPLLPLPRFGASRLKPPYSWLAPATARTVS
jgi:hypothetical protein